MKKGNKIVYPVGSEYQLSFINNKEVGTGVAVITGKGEKKGFIGYATFKILQQVPSGLKYSVKPVKSHGTVKSLKITVKNGRTVLTEGKDYVVNYFETGDNGEGKAYLTFRGNYIGTKELTFHD